MWPLFAVMFGIWMLACIGILGPRFFAPEPTSRADLGDPAGYLRGNAYLVIRLPALTLPVEQIQVFADHEAARAFVPSQGRFVQVPFPAELGVALQEVHTQWCADLPRGTRDRTRLAYEYEIAFGCGGYPTYTIQLPPEQLPEPLQTLIDSLPPVPTEDV
jgi:hypothetical protein